MLNILSLLTKNVGWGKIFNYGVLAFRFFKKFKGVNPFSLGKLFGAR